MAKAEESRQKHRPEQEIEHLKKAVLLDPEYVAARNRLGNCLIATEPDSAIAQWEEAIKVNPRKVGLFNNLAIGYLMIDKLADAERAARTAIELDTTSNRPRALLGLVLYSQKKYTAEASALLESASSEFPAMRVFAAQLLIRRGELPKARTHLQAYLSSGETEYRNAVSEMFSAIAHIDLTRESSHDQSQISGGERRPGVQP